MKNLHQGIHNTCSHSKSRSKSKSISSPKQSKKAPLTSPQKDRKQVLIKVRPSSKAQIDEKKQKFHHNGQKQKKFYSTSKSKSKSKEKSLKHPKQFQSQKKMAVQSPYTKKIIQPKKVRISTPGNNDNLKREIQDCNKKILNGHYQQAQKTLIKIFRHHPKNFDACYLLGYIGQLKHHDQNAKNHYRICIKMYSNQINSLSYKSVTGKDKDFSDPQRLQKLLKCYFYLHIFDTVIDICNKILIREKSAHIYQLKGKAQLARKKYGPGIDSFANAIALDKNNFVLYQLQGDCYRGIQAYELALNCYSKSSQYMKAQSIRILQKKAQCFKLLNNSKKQQQIKDKIHKLSKQPLNSIKISLIPQKKVQNNSQLSNNSTTKSYQLSSLPQLKPQTASISQVQQIYLKGNVELSLKMVQKIIESEGYNLRNLYWNAFLLFQIQSYQECQKKLNLAIKQLQDPTLPLLLHTLSDPQQLSIINNLKIIINKLKELNAFTLTQEQDAFIMQRRKKCLQEALNVFKNRQISQSQNSSLFNSQLTIIMEENSMIHSSKIYDNEQNSIFMLRYIRKVLQNWCKHKFSLQSLQKTTDLAFNLVKIRSKQFSILPMHIIYFTIRQQNNNKTFRQINESINKMLSEMDKKYPAHEANLTISTRNIFDIKFQNKPKVNLFHSVFKNQKLYFNSFKQLHKVIQIVADKAKEQYGIMNEICREICVQKNPGFGFKMGLKVDKNSVEFVQERVLIRIIQKILRNQIKQKVNRFLDILLVKPGKKMSDYFSEIQKHWQQTIQQIVRQKSKKNEEVLCDIYDLIRAKCMFSSVKEIRKVTQDFLELDSKGKIEMIQITNRLEFKTKDVMLKFRVKDIIGELQLTLQFQSIQNEFNHGLYQLFRSPFGAFFASVMWFSGFAIRKNQIFYKQKIKWNLKGLQHLRKFIYEQELFVTFSNENDITSQELLLVDFQVRVESICSYVCTKTHLFLAYDHQRNKVIVQLEKPRQKFIIKLVNQNLVVEEQLFYSVQVRVQGTQIFVQLQKNGNFRPILLQNSITAQILRLKIHTKHRMENLSRQDYQKNKRQLFSEYNYNKQIQQCKKNQKMLIQMLNQLNN